MDNVSTMQDRDFEFKSQPRGEDGTRLVILVSKVGGGTLGRAYDGRWLYRVRPVSRRAAVLAEGNDLNTGTPKTHAEAAEIVADFVRDLTPE